VPKNRLHQQQKIVRLLACIDSYIDSFARGAKKIGPISGTDVMIFKTFPPKKIGVFDSKQS
jgi:hypothetical protein